MSSTWSWIQGQLVETSKKAAQLACEAQCQPHPRKKLVWEVYSGTGLLGEQAERPMRSGLNNGCLQTGSSKALDGNGLRTGAR